ncbi:CaiB/BaiF CoA-transferase family protein [Amycolatopsis sp. Poz14]|uniref:CaiB/BaiF CoA transferase family protein n=1 Tax=Amycolatopsis sp. Poz14 TaxID=1447705 RepID=UPI001EE84F4B|nr:CaiB/BaiF CoA-transferase family protein [Amycolatopsis sp. Poz14]MCG3753976.1 CoA transferase [Amycolatopsis sp. Poz14]
MSAPLAGIRVLDLSALLPGPMATLLLAEAGADVVKIERPPDGDEMRAFDGPADGISAAYTFLNGGKRVFAADLKNLAERDRVRQLAAEADVLVEQFRPGVAARLGLGYEDVRAVNEAIVYCSITGYGQTGALARKAGHDLNYLADAGVLGAALDGTGQPALPPVPIADIAGGCYPAVLNILLALRRRDLDGTGCRLDISMTHSLQLLAYAHTARYAAEGEWPRPSGTVVTGGTPWYAVYQTADNRFVAVGALEERFRRRLAELVGLSCGIGDGDQVRVALSAGIRSRTAAAWREVFAGEDVCANVVNTFAEAEDAGLVDTSGRLRTVVAETLRVASGSPDAHELPPLPFPSGWPQSAV